MTQEISYVPDYRSTPSGCGTIKLPNGKMILITSTGSEDYLYNYPKNTYYDIVIDIPIDQGGIHYKLFYQVLKVVLNNLNVTHVYDIETALDAGIRDSKFSLDSWFSAINM